MKRQKLTKQEQLTDYLTAKKLVEDLEVGKSEFAHPHNAKAFTKHIHALGNKFGRRFLLVSMGNTAALKVTRISNH